MSRNHVSSNIAGFGQIVNVAVSIAAVILIGAGYFSAVGSFAGIA